MSRKLAVYHKSDHEELQKTKRQKRSNTQASSRRLHIAVLQEQACRRTSHNACGDTVRFLSSYRHEYSVLFDKFISGGIEMSLYWAQTYPKELERAKAEHGICYG